MCTHNVTAINPLQSCKGMSASISKDRRPAVFYSVNGFSVLSGTVIANLPCCSVKPSHKQKKFVTRSMSPQGFSKMIVDANYNRKKKRPGGLSGSNLAILILRKKN